MGQRCNLVIAGPSNHELFYSHWRANSLDTDLFWGPEHAMAFARRQRTVGDGACWLDTVWAEGGAVIDPGRRSLLWWGGEDTLYDVDLRRLLLAWMARSWTGWEVRWATRGIVDQALQVGLPVQTVLGPRPEARAPHLEAPIERDWVDSVLSVRHADGRLRFFQLPGKIRERLWDCARLVRLAEAIGGEATCDLRWLRGSLEGGAHVDVPGKRVSWWSASPEPWSHLLGEANRDWTVEWVEDRYEEHLKLSGPDLVFPMPELRDLETRVRAILLHPDRDRSELATGVVAALPGRSVQVNPFALRDDPLPLRLEERARRLDTLLR